MAGNYNVQFLPTNVTAVLTVPDTVTEQQLTDAIRDWRRMADPQQELPFPTAPQPEQLCLKFT